MSENNSNTTTIKIKNDLTQGSTMKKILFFTLPILIGSIFQQLYSVVDSIIVGRTLGKDPFTAVGTTGSLSFLILGFAQGITAGFAVLMSQYFGAKDIKNMKRSMGTSYILSAVVSVVLTIIAVACCKPLLAMMDTLPEYFDYAYSYISTIFWGLSASVFYNLVSYMLRALGDSRTPLYFLIVASILNIGLDFLFILVFKMGVAGAGWATVFSQVLSGIACLLYMLKKYPQIRLSKDDFKTSWKMCWKHLRIAFPMGFQFSIIAIGIMIQQTAINGLQDTAVNTAYNAASKIDNFATLSLTSLGAAMATFCGQNYGAGKYQRLREGVRKAMLLCVGIVIVTGAMVWIFGKQLTYFFVSDATPTEVDLSIKYQRIQASLYIFLASIYVYRNSLQGMGRSNITVVAGVLELVMRSVAAFVLVRFFAFDGVCVSNPIAWVGANIILLPAYFVAIRKLIKKQVNAPVQADETQQIEQATTDQTVTAEVQAEQQSTTVADQENAAESQQTAENTNTDCATVTK